MKRKYLAALVAAASLAALASVDHNTEVAQNLRLFNSLYRELDAFYVDSIDAEEAVGGAIRSMLNRVDPYTVYMTAEEVEDWQRMSTGRYSGIGSSVMRRDSATYISYPGANSPAARAGLWAGDRILAIDGKEIGSRPLDEVSASLRGDAGTHVRVKVSRPYVGADSILEFDIERGEISEPSVAYQAILEDSIGYIALESYTETSPAEVKDALLAFKRAGAGVKGVVLDLRGNPGGLLESAIQILGYFLPNGTEVLRTRDRAGQERVYRTTSQPILPDIPLVVLANNNTASAAEVTAGALQDLDRAVIMGRQSYGKGLVQVTRELPGSALLKVTVAKYYLPSGRLIQAIDYSHRNADGSVSAIPDSLRNEFRTRGGRLVRDGGGLEPDVAVNSDMMSQLGYALLFDNMVYDWATRYHAQHPGAFSPEEWEVTDSLYADFKASVNPEQLHYEDLMAPVFSHMRRIATEEGYLNDSVASAIDALEQMMKLNLDADLDLKRPEISTYLASEVASRYLYESGRRRASIPADNVLSRARALLHDEREYRSLLTTTHQ